MLSLLRLSASAGPTFHKLPIAPCCPLPELILLIACCMTQQPVGIYLHDGQSNGPRCIIQETSTFLQVRFGVLNAGNFGVSQSRKRTFIWGVAPNNILPDWPKPQHVFRSSQLTINLPGNVQVSTVYHTCEAHAPL